MPIKTVLSVFCIDTLYVGTMKKLLFLFSLLLITLFVVELASPALKIFVQPFTALLATMSISLFYLGQWNMTTFEWAYLYLWQALIMLDVFIVFLLWLKFAPQQRETAGATADSSLIS